MKKIRLFLIIATLFAAVACSEKKLDMYGDESFIQFGPLPEYIYDKQMDLRDTVKDFSFVYDENLKVSDVKFDIYVSGGSRDYDRPFVLEQLTESGSGVNNAVSGTNFRGFDSPKMKNEYVIPAGKVHIEVPIRIIRPDDGDSKVYTLRFRVVDNEHFTTGHPDLLWRKVTFTSELQRPPYWKGAFESWFLGSFSKTKLKFMMDYSGLKWDAECWVNIYGAELNYWLGEFKNEIARINRKRAENNNNQPDPWKDELGNEIKFI